MSMSFSRKLNRASKHIEDLGHATQAWLGTDAYSLRPEPDPHTGRTVIRAHITEPPHPEIAAILGDAVHNLRSTLDHLILELAVSNNRPHPVPADIEGRSEFPIFPDMVGSKTGSAAFHERQKKSREPTRASGLYKLRGLHQGAIEAIEGIQPYHRGTDYVKDPLWVVHELDRIDKHRRLNLTAYALRGFSMNPLPGKTYIEHLVIETHGYEGPVQHGTKVASIEARNAGFQLNFAREVALAEVTLPNNPFVMQTVTQLRDYVRDRVIPLLKPFL